ncbi:Tol-Pal system beta propeller repeat protein TolB [Ferrigenium sp. UT5]|uniref:Tol-Pal system beta propeller repeat protein TolB n=1 Tax=Ferrigenium sp. UT5 TaxID=3242105 RepID=UPI003551AC84
MLRWIVLCLLLIAAPVRAELSIEITGAGEHQTPLSLVRFAGDPLIAQSLLEVIGNDLSRTGLFKLVDPAGKLPHRVAEVRVAEWAGVETLLLGTIQEMDGEQLAVRFSLFDVVRNAELMAQVVTAKRTHLRAISHRIADRVYERLTGSPGVFGTRIVYVNRDQGSYRLVVADSDGYGEQSLLTSKEPIMSPAWSPDGKQIAYVSFERQRAMVYVQALDSAQRRLIADFPGSNSAPVWSPDGKQLALVLTRDGSSNLYLTELRGRGVRQLTQGYAIDTEPVFSIDGQSLLFTSDRGGNPQIYRLSLKDERIQRLTFESGSAFSPRPSPDGRGFVFSLYKEGVFYVAVQDFESGQAQILTAGGWEKKPSFAPNGKMILFATEVMGRGILATVSSDGRVKQKMVAQRGDIREPMWGPYLK